MTLRTVDFSDYFAYLCTRRCLAHRRLIGNEIGAILQYTDPARYEELCRKGIDWMDADLRKDEALKAMCHAANLHFDSIIKEEKEKTLRQFDVSIN